MGVPILDGAGASSFCTHGAASASTGLQGCSYTGTKFTLDCCIVGTELLNTVGWVLLANLDVSACAAFCCLLSALPHVVALLETIADLSQLRLSLLQ